jgi:hypothetical protein
MQLRNTQRKQMKIGPCEQVRVNWQTAAKKTARVSECNRSVLFRSVGCLDTCTLIVGIREKAQISGEYGRKVDARVSSQLANPPRRTLSPASVRILL